MSSNPNRSAQMPWTPVLGNTIAFAVAFAAWVMLGPSSRVIAHELGLTPDQGALLKALPILTGSVLRIPVGILADRIGARRIFGALLLLGGVTAAVLSTARSFPALAVGALLLGLVGTTFVTGVQSVAAVAPRTMQGTALGVFGAGNAGTAVTSLAMPLLLVALGWRHTFQAYGAALAVAAVAYMVVVRDVPRPANAPPRGNPLAPMLDGFTWLIGFYYMATFGVFVATTLAISDVYVDGYGRSLKIAGILATSFTLTASFSRIPGGAIADRFGADAVLRVVLPLVAATLALAASGPPLGGMVLLIFIAGIAMGIGMAATFKAIPTFFPQNVGAVGGVVGALGGIAGFYLPLAGNFAARSSHIVFQQFTPLALVAAVAALGPWMLAPRFIKATGRVA